MTEKAHLFIEFQMFQQELLNLELWYNHPCRRQSNSNFCVNQSRNLWTQLAEIKPSRVKVETLPGSVINVFGLSDD